MEDVGRPAPSFTLLNLGATYIKEGLYKRLDPRFTIRYVSAGNDSGDDETLGLWTWMDHKCPVPTVVDGRVAMEARPLYLFLHQFQEFLGAPSWTCTAMISPRPPSQ
jgi:hypothetical protein